MVMKERKKRIKLSKIMVIDFLIVVLLKYQKCDTGFSDILGSFNRLLDV